MRGDAMFTSVKSFNDVGAGPLPLPSATQLLAMYAFNWFALES